MARKTTTEFSCDRCGRKVKSAKDLRRFQVVRVRHRRTGDEIAQADFCDSCESEFLAAVEPFFAAAELPSLHAMSRNEEE